MKGDWQGPIVQVACGNSHTIALTEAGDVYSWGHGKQGALGHGGDNDEPTPKKIAGLKDIIKVDCGSEYTMALDKRGKLFAFGQNGYGQLGVVGKTTKVTEPKQIVLSAANGRVVDFSCGEEHAALLDEHGHVHTWGFGNDGQLGHGNRDSLNTPKKVNFESIVKKVGCGGGHTGFLTKEGELYLMGRGRDG